MTKTSWTRSTWLAAVSGKSPRGFPGFHFSCVHVSFVLYSHSLCAWFCISCAHAHKVCSEKSVLDFLRHKSLGDKTGSSNPLCSTQTSLNTLNSSFGSWILPWCLQPQHKALKWYPPAGMWICFVWQNLSHSQGWFYVIPSKLSQSIEYGSLPPVEKSCKDKEAVFPWRHSNLCFFLWIVSDIQPLINFADCFI